MIEIVAFLAAAAGGAAAGGAAVARWFGRRGARSSAVPEAQPSRKPKRDEKRDDLRDALVALGDVVVLDGGRGDELWLVRRAAFREQADGDAFLVLFEAYPAPNRSCGLVAWQPTRGHALDVLARRDLGATTSNERGSRPPSTLEVELEGTTEVVSLEMRRMARVSLDSLENAGDFASTLPPDGAACTVAVYGGGPHVRALVVRGDDGDRLFAGRTVARDVVEILHNRPAPTAR